MSNQTQGSESAQPTGTGCLVRLAWMLGGPAAVLVSARFICQHKGGLLSVADLVFWLAVVGAILIRRLDITRFHGDTAAGTPATIHHWHRYALGVAVISLVIWGAAHAWSYFGT